MPVVTNIEDLRALYEARVPRMFYDYTESGSWTEQTFRENSSDFAEIRLRQRVAVNMENRSTGSEMAGEKVSMPVGLSPVGLTGMQAADGEIKAARAAEKFGVPYTLSTMSVCSVEDVAEHTGKPFWFQLYVMRDRDFTSRLIRRVRDAGCSVLVLTLDLQILGQRHKDIKNGLSVPARPTVGNIANLATKWRWMAGMAATRRRTFGNIVGHIDGVTDTGSLTAWAAESFDPALDWNRVRELKDEWGGKMILKGILDPGDAEKAAEAGADAVVVSNHGGRQLDGALSSIRMLRPVRRAVGDAMEVHVDGGIRSGQDVLKALAMGADGAMMGRGYIYGLGAMGEAGVTKALELVHRELDVSMALCGKTRIEDLGPDTILVPEGFEGRWENPPG